MTQVAVTNVWILKNMHQNKKEPIIELNKLIVLSLMTNCQPQHHHHVLEKVAGEDTLPKEDVSNVTESYRRKKTMEEDKATIAQARTRCRTKHN